jgi:cell wall-associated NlpC family hydrolase
MAMGTAVATGACASSGAVPHPFPMPTHGAPATVSRPAVPDPSPEMPPANEPPVLEPTPTPTPTSSFGDALVDAALALRGTPYRNGGAEPDGFDCSGFTRYVFGQFGIALPRDTGHQYGEGRPIDADDVAKGDLVFFTTVARGPSHVGIAIDREHFVHAPSSSGVVRVERLGSSYWSRRYVGARRVAGLNPE